MCQCGHFTGLQLLFHKRFNKISEILPVSPKYVIDQKFEAQNLACPHGSSATPERGAIRHTSHQSSRSELDDVTVDAAAAVTAAEASAAGGVVAAVCCCSWIRHQQIVEDHDEVCNKQTGLQA